LNRLRPIALLPLVALLGACNAVVLDPSGDVAAQQRDLLVESTALMLLIIVPVMALIVFFAWRYRQSNKAAPYEPDWDHSTHLELIIWGAPLLIIICLGAMTWMGTHLLDPYRPLDRVNEDKAITADAIPLEVDVVALDWKWLFIYPQYGIATVNQLAAPVDRPLDFHITSSSVMNSFFIPALAGQIYAMPAMETRLHAVMNKTGTFQGISANYSGAGFSGMHFAFRSLAAADFESWAAGVKAAGGTLDRAGYLKLAEPSENEPPHAFGGVDAGLYRAALNLCVEPGKMCMDEMMSIDAKGGLGLEGIRNVLPLQHDHRAGGAVLGPDPTDVASLCGPGDMTPHAVTAAALAPVDTTPLQSLGLPRPSSSSGSLRMSPATSLLPSSAVQISQ
jgi:cytochrome o ubiquinol oxidase subunit 2